jgi:hypothetical protein
VRERGTSASENHERPSNASCILPETRAERGESPRLHLAIDKYARGKNRCRLFLFWLHGEVITVNWLLRLSLRNVALRSFVTVGRQNSTGIDIIIHRINMQPLKMMSEGLDLVSGGGKQMRL